MRQLGARGGLLNAAGRLTGLVSADLLLVQVLLMARIPWVERSYGQDELARRYRLVGFTSFTLMIVHIGLISLVPAARHECVEVLVGHSCAGCLDLLDVGVEIGPSLRAAEVVEVGADLFRVVGQVSGGVVMPGHGLVAVAGDVAVTAQVPPTPRTPGSSSGGLTGRRGGPEPSRPM